MGNRSSVVVTTWPLFHFKWQQTSAVSLVFSYLVTSWSNEKSISFGMLIVSADGFVSNLFFCFQNRKCLFVLIWLEWTCLLLLVCALCQLALFIQLLQKKWEKKIWKCKMIFVWKIGCERESVVRGRRRRSCFLFSCQRRELSKTQGNKCVNEDW